MGDLKVLVIMTWHFMALSFQTSLKRTNKERAILKHFHFISNDHHFLKEISNHSWGNTLIRQHDNQESFIAFRKARKESFIFLDVDSQSKLENIKTIMRLQQIVDKIIIISKDTDFAYHAIKSGIYDYCLKDNFFREALSISNSNLLVRYKKNADKIAIHCEAAVHYVNLCDIIRCQAESNYTKIIMNEGSLLIAKTLSKVEDLFPSTSFCRTHRSHLVNLKHIKMVKYEGVIITSDKCAVPIARNQKKQFWIQMKSLGY